MLVAVLVLASAAAAGAAQRDPAIDAQAAIDAANRAYLLRLERHDAAGFAALFTDDAIAMQPGGPLIAGRGAIAASMTAAFGRVTFLDGELHSVQTRLLGGGDAAVEIGTYRWSLRIDGVANVLSGRYCTVWRRVNGAWKIAVDSSQPDVQASAPPATPGPLQANE